MHWFSQIKCKKMWRILSFGWTLRESNAIELTLFMWHTPADTTEAVAEHSARLQPSINLHAPVTAFMISCSGTQCTTPEGWRLGWVLAVQWSKPHSILAPTQDSNPGRRIQNHKRWPLHYHCTHTQMTTRAGSLVYVLVESGRDRAREDISGPIPINSSSFEMATVK